MSTKWHALEKEQALKELESGPGGLSEAKAKARLAEVGPNVLLKRGGDGPLQLLLHQINDPLIWVLIGSSILALALGKVNDGLVVAAVVVINTIIGFVQEYRAGKAIEALAQMVPEFATVIRDGKTQRLPVADLVPGDVVTLASGDKGPADLRIMESKSLHVEEAALTGESVPSEKRAAVAAADAGIGDRHCMVFGGTLVTYGTATCVVVATGQQTELGRVSKLLEEATDLETPLTLTLAKVGKVITVGVLALAAVMIAVGTWRAMGAGATLASALTESAIFASALAVGAIPGGLPAIVTVALAIGVRRMAARRAIVRKLPAIETLGSTTTICTDKTGTLTRNEMTVKQLWTPNHKVQVSGVGYDPVGEFLVEGSDETLPQEVRSLLRDAALVSDATLEQVEGRWVITGDPTEAALVVAAEKAGLRVPALRQTVARIDVVPFESERQFMATLHQDGAQRRLLVKGAPEVVAGMCASAPGQAVADLERITQSVKAMADQGMRVLGVADANWTSTEPLLPEQVQRLRFVGLIGMIDPPRQEAIQAVAACHSAGITVKMITGDHVLTAAAIGRELGLVTNQPAMTGKQLEQISDQDLPEAALSTNVFARVAPEHKLRLVRALQANQSVVAMTGDGVNDAPALKQANIGVAMGIIGTSAAKEAADIVLTDDNFATIVAAVEEGRRVYDNLVKSLAFVLPTNLGLALILMVAVAFFPFDSLTGELLLPIQATQILWINLVASIALAVPLAFEVAEKDVMKRPPRAPNESPFSPFVIFRTVAVAILMAAGAIVLSVLEYFDQLAMGSSHAIAIADAQTVAVTAVVFFQVFYLLQSRSLKGTLLEVGLTSNKAVLIGIAVLVGLQVLFVMSPFMHQIFETGPISWRQVGFAALAGATVLPVVGVEKAIRRRRHSR